MSKVESAFANLVLREILLAGKGDLVRYLQVESPEVFYGSHCSDYWIPCLHRNNCGLLFSVMPRPRFEYSAEKAPFGFLSDTDGLSPYGRIIAEYV